MDPTYLEVPISLKKQNLINAKRHSDSFSNKEQIKSLYFSSRDIDTSVGDTQYPSQNFDTSTLPSDSKSQAFS